MPKPLIPIAEAIEVDLLPHRARSKVPASMERETVTEEEARRAFEDFHVQAEKFGSLSNVDR